MFTLHFTNVTNSLSGTTYPTADEAFNAGKKAGFEFSVWNGDSIVYSWSYFGGKRIW